MDRPKDLPPALERYALRATLDVARPRKVRLQQRGEMWQRPGGRCMAWTGTEELDVASVAFSWRARFPMLPLVWLQVIDAFRSGSGRLEGRLWGWLRLFRQAGPQCDVGEAIRYLAEIPWVPHAIVANRELEWSAQGDGAATVATRLGTRRIAVQLEFDEDGDIVSARSDARPRREGRIAVDRPWGGTFADYAEIGGIRIPTKGEVHWDLPEGRFVYWRGVITNVELVS